MIRKQETTLLQEKQSKSSKIYSCDQCSADFTDVQSLIDHIRTHSATSFSRDNDDDDESSSHNNVAPKLGSVTSSDAVLSSQIVSSSGLQAPEATATVTVDGSL